MNVDTRPSFWGLVGWVLVVVGLLVFWPVGLALFAWKLAVDRTAIFNGGKILQFVGIWRFFWGVPLLIIGLGSNNGMFGGVILLWFMGYILGGVLCLTLSAVVQNKANKYRRYASIVINEGITKIGDIARVANTNYNDASQTLQKMIDEGHFQGHISHKDHELILEGSHAYIRVVRCDNCGADNKLIWGQERRCDYCRSIIRIKKQH